MSKAEKKEFVTWTYYGNGNPGAKIAKAIKQSGSRLERLSLQNKYVDRTGTELVFGPGLSKKNKDRRHLQHCTLIRLRATSQEPAYRAYHEIKPYLEEYFEGIEERLLEPLNAPQTPANF